MRGALVAAWLMASTVLASCVSDNDGAGPSGWTLRTFATGFTKPLFVTHAGDGSGRLFIVEQAGKVWIWEDAARKAEPFLDVSGKIPPSVATSSYTEQGLLSLAFHPEYASNGLAFVYYTNREGNIEIAKYRVASGNPDRLDPTTAEVILTIDHSRFANHNGGMAEFGPDGYLYLGVGDGGGAGDPEGNAQNRLTLLGKLLRIDVNVPRGYAIPPDNPYANEPYKKEIWAYGLRNPWRFSFDRTTGDLYLGDVGQNAWEEVNFQSASSRGGENYGWNVYEGNHEYESGTAPGAVFPVAEYAQEGRHCSVTGGYVYRGKLLPPLQDLYFFSDWCSGYLWTLERNGTEWKMNEVRHTGLAVSSFGEDEGGGLYVVDHAGGAVYQFISRAV